MKINSFSKTYDDRVVLNVPEMTIPDGKIISVIGTNGSGKSTFAKILSKIENPDDMRKDVMEANVELGYLPQRPYIFNMSLKKNMNIIDGESQELMIRLKIKSLENENAKKLSGGEAAKLSLGRILKKNFDVLFLDEPTSAMDIESTLTAEDLIKEYNQKTGATVFIITHELKQARRISDYVMFFDKGEPVSFDDTEKVLGNPSDERLINFIKFYGA